MGKEIILEAVIDALKIFAKDKIPGSYVWPVEFFLVFVDISRKELKELVEFSRSE